MKKLDTSPIIVGVGYPPSKKGIEFLYESNFEMFKAIGQSLGGDSLTGTEAYALYGCVKTDLGSGNFSFTAGYIYNAATTEIYFSPAVASIAIATQPILSLDTTPSIKFPTAYNPVLFTNNTTNDVHVNNQLVISDGALNSGLINFKDLIYVNRGWASYVPTLSADDTLESPVVGGFTGTPTGKWAFKNNTLHLKIKVTAVATLNTACYLNISLPIPVSSHYNAEGFNLVKYYDGSAYGVKQAQIQLRHTGQGNRLRVSNFDSSAFASLSGGSIDFEITIGFRKDGD